MTKKQTQALAEQVPQELLNQLNDSMPVEDSYERIMVPRLGMYSQDKTDSVINPKTKKKEITLIAQAGMFFKEVESEDTDENGKRIWTKDEIDTSIEAIIVYSRKQLKFYDEPNAKFISSAIYDAKDDQVALFDGKTKIATGTPDELKANYNYKDPKDGKIKSQLKETKILYVIYEGELHQISIGGSSMYSFNDYNRKSAGVASVVTRFDSKPEKNGAVEWNKMTFSKVRNINMEEFRLAQEFQAQIKHAIDAEKAFFAKSSVVQAERLEAGEEEEEEDEMVKDALKDFK